MRGVLPSMLVREDLEQLLHGEHSQSTNLISSLFDVTSRLVIEELLASQQAASLGGRGRDER